MKNLMTWSNEYRRELLTEWWELKKSIRLANSLYGATLLMRNRQRSIEKAILG